MTFEAAAALMKPSSNLSPKKFTRVRVAPIISASVSRGFLQRALGIGLAVRASSGEVRAAALSLELNS